MNFLDRFFRKILKYGISLKTVEWEQSCSVRTDGWSDRHDEANSCSSHFGESRLKMNQSMLYREVIAFSSEITTPPDLSNILTFREVWCKSNFAPVGILYTQGRQYIYRVSQEECARLREGVPYVKIYRYNPKHLCPKLNGYGDNGQRKVWSSGGSTHCTCQLTTVSMSVLECGVILRQFSSRSL